MDLHENGKNVANGGDTENLHRMRCVEILLNDAQNKFMIFHAKEEDGVGDSATNDAVILLEKKPFSAEIVKEILSESGILKEHVKNDIYLNCDLLLPAEANAIKATVIYPATKKHIEKYRQVPIYMVNETPEQYSAITLPHIESHQFGMQWVFNILEHKAEADRIIFEDADPEVGFLLAPDLKWDGKNVENMYCTAIVHKRGIKSLRDLITAHLPLLRNVWAKGCAAIHEKYGISANQLRVYVHYLPTYYHFHVHFNALNYDARGIQAGKAHLLPEIIANIEMCGNFYQKVTLCHMLKENDPLYAKFKQAN